MKVSSTHNVGVESLKIVVYGSPGAGKTYLAGTIKEPVLVISAESGLLSLHNKKIDVIDISTNDEGEVLAPEKRIARLGEVYQFLLTKEAQAKYKWIFIDSLTEISQCIIAKLSIEYPDRSQSLVMYGENAKLTRSLVKSFRDLSQYNVVMTALAAVDKDENNQRFLTIDLVGNFASKLPGFFDEVFYLSVDKDGNRTLLTNPTEKIIAKDRSSKLDKFEAPDLGLIASKIRSTTQPKEEVKKNVIKS